MHDQALDDAREDESRNGAAAEFSGGGRHGTSVRLAAYLTAGLLAVGGGFGLAKAIGSSGPAAISSVIPSPAQGTDAFVEDDNLTAQDNQSDILQTTMPGLVHIISGKTAVGIGMVLTPSGKVLTSYVPARGAASLTAQYIASGARFRVRIIGADPAAGLALLQLEGGDGRAFSTLTVGNSATIAAGASQSKEFSYHMAGEVLDTVIGTSGTEHSVSLDLGTLDTMNATATVDGRTERGLMASVLQSPPTTAIGGPVVDLNGEVIGIVVAGTGSGLAITGYAMPINTVLSVAAQIDRRAGSSG
jgi:S1-C subfamily serine protease